jgi:hypothetical protein
MALSEDHIRRAVDEALAPVWIRERRRARRRWAWETAGRVVAGLAALGALALTVRIAMGVSVPWIFFACMAVLMTALAFSQSEGREHLREGRPSTPS